MNEEPLLLIPYLRVSTDDQENSMEMQLASVERYCKYHGHIMGTPFADTDVSAYTEMNNRPAGKKLLAEVNYLVSKGTKCGIVTLKVDRMFRNSIDAQLIVRGWNDDGIPLYVIAMGGASFNTSTSIGWLFFQTLVSFAEFERNQISERTKAVKQHLKDNLKKNGAVVYGWVSDVEGNLSEHPEEAQAIRMAFRLKEDGFSLQHIADEFNMLGYKTKSGSRFQPVTIMRILNYEPNLKLLRNDD